MNSFHKRETESVLTIVFMKTVCDIVNAIYILLTDSEFRTDNIEQICADDIF